MSWKYKVKIKISQKNLENVFKIKEVLLKYNLRTVCELDKCPNLFECWYRNNVTFIVLGSTCTRSCPFCAIPTKKIGDPVDPKEPINIAMASKELKLKHVVITSVNRDDLSDYGASHFASIVKELKRYNPECIIELLIPDFNGDPEAIKKVIRSEPHIIGHNIETVRRLHPKIKPMGDYDTSLRVLRMIKEFSPKILTKSAIILGFGESLDEVKETMRDLKEVMCDIILIGQYMRPTHKHMNIKNVISEEDFKQLEEYGRKLGFLYVKCGPLVRSSYLAGEIISIL